ncbi:MAG: hypothetical protein GY938_02965 [Ketobacter sp.]|nr:hypothetical protein [Ketobacter sp.]
MSFWQKIQQIAAKIKELGTSSIRKIAEATGFSKSSVHRHLKAKERRNQYPESHLWETEEGQQWLGRLMAASIFHFGLKRGVGMDSISAFLKELRLQTHLGISTTALKGVRKQLEKHIIEYGRVHQEQGAKASGPREMVGGVDETFFEQMVLVMLDLPSGYLIMEEFSGKRTFKSWQEKAEQALKSLNVQVRYLVSDRAKALIKLAVEHFGCRSIADLFHPLHEIAKGFSFAIQNRLNQAQKKLEKAEKVLAGSPPQSEPRQQQNQQQQELAQEVEKWKKVQEQYKELMQQFSLSIHPFAVEDNSPQNAAIVEKQLRKTVAQLEKLAQTNQLSKADKHLKPVKNQLPDLASLMNVWWDWVDHSLVDQTPDFLKQLWLKEILLPKIYWEGQLQRCRSAKQRPIYQAALSQAQQKLDNHPLTPLCHPAHWQQYNQWAETMVARFQRTSSPVEGRNGFLSQIHQAGRGISQKRLPVLRVLHNFELKRADGTTAAERFFEMEFPDLFEWILPQMGDLPLPRNSRSSVSTSSSLIQGVPP